ncbi:hypothetical protein N7532_011266 [Penicillium argentinense]|uniref:Uncharacterized protein n=1 Tax=Penicillium argentinense TaxID=1131581 RepID=A0A9W9EI41_9EURO|nr:uncharacterized protein N7532_011266 [Penicillium argentinense]KAJ5082223.1 hypothetical protein N7532_011266 [Penicillium argentinense]
MAAADQSKVSVVLPAPTYDVDSYKPFPEEVDRIFDQILDEDASMEESRGFEWPPEPVSESRSLTPDTSLSLNSENLPKQSAFFTGPPAPNTKPNKSPRSVARRDITVIYMVSGSEGDSGAEVVSENVSEMEIVGAFGGDGAADSKEAPEPPKPKKPSRREQKKSRRNKQKNVASDTTEPTSNPPATETTTQTIPPNPEASADEELEDEIFRGVGKTKRNHILQYIAFKEFMHAEVPVKRSERREFIYELRKEASHNGLDKPQIDALVRFTRKTFLEDKGLGVDDDGSSFGEEVLDDAEPEPTPVVEKSPRKRGRSQISLSPRQKKAKSSKKTKTRTVSREGPVVDAPANRVEKEIAHSKEDNMEITTSNVMAIDESLTHESKSDNVTKDGKLPTMPSDSKVKQGTMIPERPKLFQPEKTEILAISNEKQALPEPAKDDQRKKSDAMEMDDPSPMIEPSSDTKTLRKADKKSRHHHHCHETVGIEEQADVKRHHHHHHHHYEHWTRRRMSLSDGLLPTGEDGAPEVPDSVMIEDTPPPEQELPQEPLVTTKHKPSKLFKAEKKQLKKGKEKPTKEKRKMKKKLAKLRDGAQNEESKNQPEDSMEIDAAENAQQSKSSTQAIPQEGLDVAKMFGDEPRSKKRKRKKSGSKDDADADTGDLSTPAVAQHSDKSKSKRARPATPDPAQTTPQSRQGHISPPSLRLPIRMTGVMGIFKHR